jgi:hypothetical protein
MTMERRTLQELLTLHTLEPSLRDIVVEGEYDQRLFRWFLGDKAVIHFVGSIEMDDGLLINAGRKANNRERVILLGELAEKKIPEIKSLRGVIDRDYDDYIDDYVIPQCVIRTDFTCIEMYAWEARVMGHFLAFFCGKNDIPSQTVFGMLGKALPELFAIRVVGERMVNVMLDWIDPDRYVTLVEGVLLLDRNRFILALLQKTGSSKHLAKFLRQVEALLASFPEDLRFQIHGHDFTLLLKVAMKEMGVQRELLNAVTLAHGLAISITANRDSIANHGLFQQLCEFAEN